MKKLRKLIELLASEDQLPARYRDHPLKGVWSGCRDVHIEPDWLLIFRIAGKRLELLRSGTHAGLLGE